MELKAIRIEIPKDANVIIGQTHFIKTIEDLYEILVSSMPNIHFAISFCEASGQRKVRVEANDQELREIAIKNALAVGAGHTFFILIRDAYPINILNRIKDCPEVCNIYCATANPVEVIVAETGQGRGILGVIDGEPPLGVEESEDVAWRKGFLRKIGYKL